MKFDYPNIPELLDATRQLVENEQFDAAAAVELLDALTAEDLDVQTSGAVRHAKRTALLACSGNSMQATIARYALSRVIVLLDKQVEVAAPANGFGTMSPTQ